MIKSHIVWISTYEVALGEKIAIPLLMTEKKQATFPKDVEIIPEDCAHKINARVVANFPGVLTERFEASIAGMANELCIARMKSAIPTEAASEPFKATRIDMDSSGVTVWAFEDCATVARDAFPGVHHFIDELRAMDDGRLVGVQSWGPPPARAAEPGEAVTLDLENSTSGVSDNEHAAVRADLARMKEALDVADRRLGYSERTLIGLLAKAEARVAKLEDMIGPCGCEPDRCEQHPQIEDVYYGRLCRDRRLTVITAALQEPTNANR